MRISPPIDYSLISDAMRFYTALGYEQVEVPWIVENSISKLTCKDDDLVFKTVDNTALIGSAEQGLLSRVCDDDLPFDKWYVSCSPCFRVNHYESPYHFDQFMKVELGRVLSFESLANTSELSRNIEHEVLRVIHHAQSFFESRTNQEVSRVNTEEGIDLFINGIEIGSYGFRPIVRSITQPRSIERPRSMFVSFIWVYGTGLALPRFTQAVSSGGGDNP